MNHSSNILDLSSLPEQARTELLAFYDFLSKKYDVTGKTAMITGKARFSKFLGETVYVEELKTYSREVLHERR